MAPWRTADRASKTHTKHKREPEIRDMPGGGMSRPRAIGGQQGQSRQQEVTVTVMPGAAFCRRQAGSYQAAPVGARLRAIALPAEASGTAFG